MPRIDIVWDPAPDGNIEHIAEHNLTPEDIEEVLWNPIGMMLVVQPDGL